MKQDEMILKTVKEIVVKFIEVGNISPTSFHDHFRNIYSTVEKSVRQDGGKQKAGTEKE
ncbi:MAG: conjugal transfer protein TraB [Desulfobacterales bacterium]|nr:conjugal transfer protein TraB [Desulfobacterales bacterium]